MKINDLIFNELVKRGYKDENGTRVWDIADSKLWYLTPKQAQGYLDLSNTKGYKENIIDKEITLINQYMPDLLEQLSESAYNIIDLGCGDGVKASLFIHKLAQHMNIRYCPIDISAYMVSKAAEIVRDKQVAEVLEFKWNISDFENLNNVTPLFRDDMFNHHFMMLLGNTLGNFESEHMLHGIKESMNESDVLLIGNGLTNGKENWSEEYKDSLINEWLVEIPHQIGLSDDDISYDVRFKNSRVEELYILTTDKHITHLGKTISFKKGDIIVTAISYKYTKDKLTSILENHFSEVTMYSDTHHTYALALCKK